MLYRIGYFVLAGLLFQTLLVQVFPYVSLVLRDHIQVQEQLHALHVLLALTNRYLVRPHVLPVLLAFINRLLVRALV